MEIWSLTRPAAGEERADAHAARAVEPRRPALAADPDPGLLEHPPTAARAPRPRVRVHAPVGRPRGARLELRADDRRLPGRPPPRAAAAGAAARSTSTRSTGRSSTSASEAADEMTEHDVRRGRRGRPRHHRRLHPGPRRRPHRRRRRHLLPRRFERDPGPGHPRGPRRPARGLLAVGAAAAPAPPRAQHPGHRVERRRGHRRQRPGLHPAGQGRAGRSSWSAATTTRCTARDGTWRFHRRVAEFVT